MTSKFLSLFLLSFILAACGGKKSPEGGASAPNAPEPAPGPAGKPVDVGPPNADDQSPAFPEQTRAPEVKSSVEPKVDTITSNLERPWGMVFLPNGNLLVTEKGGTLRQVSPDGNVGNPISGVPAVVARGQGGLLDVNLARDFESSRWVYLSYSEQRDGSNTGTTVGRGKLSQDGTALNDWEVIFQQTPSWDSGAHFGSRLIWDASGKLFITLGDRSNQYDSRVLAQDLNGLLGKVVRVNADGSVPDDNPFTNGGGLPQIWSYGHRNIQGAALHPVTGALWTIEHGPQGGDELNSPEAGKNYGWPTISYGVDYGGAALRGDQTAKDGMEQPIYYWDPVIAPSGMTFYEGNMFEAWRGNLLVGGLKTRDLVRLVISNNLVVGEERLLSGTGRVRDVEVADDGSIWVATDGGALLRLSL